MSGFLVDPCGPPFQGVPRAVSTSAVEEATRLVGKRVQVYLRPGGRLGRHAGQTLTVLGVVYDGEWRLVLSGFQHNGSNWSPRLGIIDYVELDNPNIVKFT